MTDETEPDKTEGSEEAVATPVVSGAPISGAAQAMLAAFMITALAVGVYLNSMSAPLLEPARDQLIESGAYDSLENAWNAEGIYSPLASFFHVWLGDETGWAHRVLAIVLHALSSVLVFLVARFFIPAASTEAIPMLSGALFAVHPIATSQVNDPLQLHSMLVVALSLTALVCGLRALQSSGRFAVWVGAGLAAFALAWTASPAAWVVPVILALAAWALPGDAPSSGRMKQVLLANVGLLALLFALSAALGRGGDFEALIAQSGTLLPALGHTVFPFGKALSSYPPPLAAGLGIGHAVAGVLLLAGIGLYRVFPVAGFGILWFLLALIAPGLYGAEQAFGPAGLYAALPGLLILAPWVLQPIKVPSGRALAGGAAALLVLACAAITVTRNQVWSNPESYWAAARTQCSTCAEPALYLARYGLAHELSLTDPSMVSSPDTRSGLEGIIEVLSGFVPKVEDPEPYQRTLLDAKVALELFLMRTDPARDRSGLLQELLGAVERNPNDSNLLLQTGRLSSIPRDFDSSQRATSAPNWRDARPYFREAYRLDPNKETRLHYLDASMGLGDIQTASTILQEQPLEEFPERYLQQAAMVQSTVQAANQLQQRLGAITDRQQGTFLQAQQDILLQRFRRASYRLEDLMRTGDSSQETWALLAISYFRQGQFDAFAKLWPPGIENVPDGVTWSSLALETARRGEWPLAHTALNNIPEYRDEPLEMGAVLTDIALEVGSSQYAMAVLVRLAQAHAQDPRPWLALADLSMAPGSGAQPEQAAQFLNRAAALGASEEELQSRRGKMNLPEATSAFGIEQTIIQ